jgi:hypothetical protein
MCIARTHSTQKRLLCCASYKIELEPRGRLTLSRAARRLPFPAMTSPLVPKRSPRKAPVSPALSNASIALPTSLQTFGLDRALLEGATSPELILVSTVSTDREPVADQSRRLRG